MKINTLTILIVSVLFSLAILSYGYFWHYQPNMTEAGYQQEYGDKLQTEADKLPQAKRRVQQAVAMVEEMGSQWQNVVLRKTPPQSVAAGGIDLSVNRWQLTVDTRAFRNNVQRAVNRQVKRGGVQVISGPEVKAPSDSATNVVEGYFNIPPLPFPVAIFDLGAVTVTGTLQQIYNNVRQWSRMPNYLAVTDGLVIGGTSPRLVGTYNVTVVAFIRGDKIFPPVPEGSGGNNVQGINNQFGPGSGPTGSGF